MAAWNSGGATPKSKESGEPIELWEILVPCQYNDGKPVTTRHHKEWDKYVRKLAGGLTIMKPAKGVWVHEEALFEERMIPVRIACSEKVVKQVMTFTLSHYRQIKVMAYRVSTYCLIMDK